MGTHTRWDRFSGGPYNKKQHKNTNKLYIYRYVHKNVKNITDELNWVLAKVYLCFTFE